MVAVLADYLLPRLPHRRRHHHTRQAWQPRRQARHHKPTERDYLTFSWIEL